MAEPEKRPKLPPDDPFSDEADERRADIEADMIAGKIPRPSEAVEDDD